MSPRGGRGPGRAALPGVLALMMATAPRAGADEPIASAAPAGTEASHLVIDAGWKAYLILDREEPGPDGKRRLVPVEEIAKRANESRFLTLPPGRYHLFQVRPRDEPQAVATVDLAPGATAVVQQASFVRILDLRAAAGAEAVPKMVRRPPARALYPRTAAARPLTLPSMMGEIAVDVSATWFPSPPARIVFEPNRLRSRASITDRIEARGLGVYGAFLAPPPPPEGEADRRTELAAGVGLAAFGGYLLNLNGTSSGVLGVDAAVDLKQHLQRAVALQLGLTGGVHLAAFGSVPVDRVLSGFVELQLDLARIVSLLVTVAAGTGQLYQVPTTAGAAGRQEVLHRVRPSLGLQVAPLTWLEVGLAAGPEWQRTDPADWQLAWVAVAQLVFRM